MAQTDLIKLGNITSVNGPVVRAKGSRQIRMREVALIGAEHLIGEVVELKDDEAVIQVYEETTGLTAGTPVYGTGALLSVELGPGLVGNIFDGLQRPLAEFVHRSGPWIARGGQLRALDRARQWDFRPVLDHGQRVEQGTIVGIVPETPLIQHRIMAPMDLEGTVNWVAPEGAYSLEDPIVRIHTPSGERVITMLTNWPVRQIRPYRRRLRPSVPLMTGQRVIDTLFPISKGGAGVIPGGFGTGKTIIQHALAKWCDADLIVYIGCGERGNEMTGVLHDFLSLEDPKTGRPLVERTIMIANTSNMPVAAREASIYVGITLAEYYRDMGLNVAVMADSTSRWAEALREISGRLEEMPAEEGFPAYLATRLAEFYERAGRVETLSGQEGSITIIGAVSPPGGDFSEPVTQHTRRFVRCFWSLDRDLAYARHFPAIHPVDSYSEYTEDLNAWWIQYEPEWMKWRTEVLDLMRRDRHLQQLAKLVGEDALPDEQRLMLLTARLWREAFLQQSALDPQDRFTSPEQQMAMMRVLHRWFTRAKEVIQQRIPFYQLRNLSIIQSIIRMKEIPSQEMHGLVELMTEIDRQMAELMGSRQ